MCDKDYRFDIILQIYKIHLSILDLIGGNTCVRVEITDLLWFYMQYTIYISTYQLSTSLDMYVNTKNYIIYVSYTYL